MPKSRNAVSEYIAFISYRHADNVEEDRQRATCFHHQSEIYDIPTELIGTPNLRGEPIPERIYPIFRDEVSLPADADLNTAITDALDISRFLIVLCSLRAVQSNYLKQEIVHFKAASISDRVIAVMLLGELNASTDPAKSEDPEDVRTLECFPGPLRYEVDVEGALRLDYPAEPLTADFRLPDGGKGLTNPTVYKQHLLDTGSDRATAERQSAAYEEKFSTAKLKIIAGILGVRLDVLSEREKFHQLKLSQGKARRARRLEIIMSVLFFGATISAYIAWHQYQQADSERSRAEALLSRVRANLNFMNFDLREVLDCYVPTDPWIKVMQSIDAIVEDIEQLGGGKEDIRAAAVAQMQKAQLILSSSTLNSEDATALMEMAHGNLTSLVKNDPSNREFQYDLTVSYDYLGDNQLRLGNTAAALTHYENALVVALNLAKLDPDDSESQSDLSISYENDSKSNYLFDLLQIDVSSPDNSIVHRCCMREKPSDIIGFVV